MKNLVRVCVCVYVNQPRILGTVLVNRKEEEKKNKFLLQNRIRNMKKKNLRVEPQGHPQIETLCRVPHFIYAT